MVFGLAARTRLRLRLLVATAIGSLVLLSCGADPDPDPGPDPDSEHVVHRFVDPELRIGAKSLPAALVVSTPAERPASTGATPIATILDDTRYVLASSPLRVLLSMRPAEISDDGRIRTRVPIPPVFRDASRLVVIPHLRLDRLPADVEPRVVDVDEEAREQGLLVEVEHGAAKDAARVKLRVDAMLPLGDATLYETPSVHIPEAARLSFAIAVGPAQVGSGRVAFRASACDTEDCEPLFETTRAFGSGEPREWTGHEVDLGSLGGSNRSFRFETEALGGAPFAVGPPLWANPSIRAAGTGPLPGPNLILISLDTLRADHLGLYGYERDTSPFLDRFFGEGGTVFDHLVSAATTTGPSHMSIMTSLPPSQHGARRGLQALSARVPTLAEQLRAEGFATAAFTENGSLDRRRGFGLGFDEYFESKSSDIRSPVGDIERTLDRARSWLSRNRGARSFLFLHTYQVHAPYKPPPSYRDLFEGDGEGQRAKDPARRAPIDDYDREIRYTDDVLAKFFAWLEDAELLGRSLIVVTADHGEEFLDHGRIGHRSLPHQELVHVPFLMRGPGVPAGRRVTGLASHVDLAPTLLELLGAPSLDHARGRSLLSSMADRSPAEDALRPVFSETWALDPPYIPPSVSVQLGDHKLIRFRTAAGPAVRLYDLVEDPGEERDIAALEPLRVATLKELLDEYVALERQGGKEVEIDAALEQKLRVLGYIE